MGLSGTDIYDYIDRDPAPVLRSLACADRLIALQELARRRVPGTVSDKGRMFIIGPAPACIWLAAQRSFNVAVIGHLRESRPVLRGQAARRLPATRGFASCISGRPRRRVGQ